MKYKCLTVLFTLCLQFPALSSPFPIAPFEAEYVILHKGSEAGVGTRQLKINDNNEITYSYQTDIEWLIFSDTRKEISHLILDQNGELLPQHYIYQRTGSGPDKFFQWYYSPEENIGHYSKGKKKTHKQAVNIDFTLKPQDKLSYHLQQRLNLINKSAQKHFVYPVMQKSGNIKKYVYEYDGEEELTLPYGNIKTIRLKREVVEKEKVTYAWFAPELNYLLVRLHQNKAGIDQFEARLKSYKIK